MHTTIVQANPVEIEHRLAVGEKSKYGVIEAVGIYPHACQEAAKAKGVEFKVVYPERVGDPVYLHERATRVSFSFVDSIDSALLPSTLTTYVFTLEAEDNPRARLDLLEEIGSIFQRAAIGERSRGEYVFSRLGNQVEGEVESHLRRVGELAQMQARQFAQ